MTQTRDSDIQIKSDLDALATKIVKNKHAIRLASHADRQAGLRSMADAVQTHKDSILVANDQDMKDGRAKGLSGAMLDRLALSPERIDAVAESLRSIADLTDPVGAVDQSWTQPNGLAFKRRRIPIGVIGIIYESRPNVTADAAGLCIKSGNAFILRGGSESLRSNTAIFAALTEGAKNSPLGFMPGAIIGTPDRTAVGHLLSGLDGRVDLIIPRGGKSLVARVQSDARVPVLSHLDGLCHTYVHQDANIIMATEILVNAKMRRTGICGSTETLLIDASIASEALPAIGNALWAKGCEIRGCARTTTILGNEVRPATHTDYSTEHLDAILNVKVVEGFDAATAHIAKFGSGHTDCIITDDKNTAELFLTEVDSAIVMHNTSTQFADGGEFGFGAEIGIATGRLHARGPVGAQHLTTYKYWVESDGQVRS